MKKQARTFNTSLLWMAVIFLILLYAAITYAVAAALTYDDVSVDSIEAVTESELKKFSKSEPFGFDIPYIDGGRINATLSKYGWDSDSSICLEFKLTHDEYSTFITKIEPFIGYGEERCAEYTLVTITETIYKHEDSSLIRSVFDRRKSWFWQFIEQR